MTPPVTAIVAHNKHRIIGHNNKIPWSIPADMAFFKETTMGHAVIMGRRTWESIPEKYRPLPGRYNIVVTRFHGSFRFPPPVPNTDVTAVDSLDKALSVGRQFARKCGGEVFVIGGGEIYAEAVKTNCLTRVLVTEVAGYDDLDTGTRFPDIAQMGYLPARVVTEAPEFRIVEYKPVLTYDKINELTAEVALLLERHGVGGYEYSECMNVLRSSLQRSFEMNGVAYDRTLGGTDWKQLKEALRVKPA
jgi:dihydrofolate reductase